MCFRTLKRSRYMTSMVRLVLKAIWEVQDPKKECPKEEECRTLGTEISVINITEIPGQHSPNSLAETAPSSRSSLEVDLVDLGAWGSLNIWILTWRNYLVGLEEVAEGVLGQDLTLVRNQGK